MQFIALTAFLYVLAMPFAAAVVIENAVRAIPGNQTLHVNGLDIAVVTRPISSSLLGKFQGKSPAGETRLVKRVTNNACFYGCTRTCTNGLSSNPSSPVEADCTALKNAVDALAL
ncbi:hypothetical protein HGRIS_006198 [Hohenbuehelia grisea]|uniref:Uncharacterized protein n=1 Tax=Hohenbuehelia grisea TaxID=104357 RepID=A0ABR3K1S1_9AGAR